MKTIEEIMRELPPDLRQEVEDFAVSLLEKRKRRRARKLRQDWAGGLRDFKGEYTSLELQKKTLEWRGD